MLSCSITYSTPQDSQDAMPMITWSSGLTGVDLSAQSYQVRDALTWESVLNLTNLSSSYCGSYTCSAGDSRVAQLTTANAQVQVGKIKLLATMNHTNNHYPAPRTRVRARAGVRARARARGVELGVSKNRCMLIRSKTITKFHLYCSSHHSRFSWECLISCGH